MRWLLLSAVVLGASDLRADAREDVEAVVRAAHAAYAANDRAAVTSFWTDSPERAMLDLRLHGELRAFCVEVQSFAVESIEVDGTKATARTAAAVRRVPRVEGRTSEVLERRTWSLERVDDRWRVVRWPTEEQQLVSELLAADDATRPAVLAANAHLLGTPLMEEMVMTLEERWLVLSASYRSLGRQLRDIAAIIGDPASIALATTPWIDVVRTPAPSHRPAARTALREAIALAEAAGDVDAKAAAVGFLAIYEMDEDESSQEAERLFRWVLEHERSIRRDRTLEVTRASLGGVLMARQDYAGAYAVFQDDVRRSLRPPFMSLYFLGVIHERQNDPELALQYYLRALDPKVSRPGPILVFTHTGLGNAYRALGDLERSREHQQQALALARADKRPGVIARTVVPLAESYVQDGETERAAELLAEAIAGAIASGSLAPHIDALLTLGRIQLLLGRTDDALHNAAEVLKISDTLDFPGYERYAALMLRGRAHRQRKDEAAAVEAFAGAIARLEEVRGQVAGAERQRRLFFEPFSGGYVEMVDLLLRQERVAEALVYAERAKARVLFDALQNGRTASSLSPADREEREARLRTLQGLNRSLIQARARAQVDTAAVARIEAELRRAQADFDALESRLATRGGSTKPAAAQPFDDALLRRLVQRPGVAYAEFVVHEGATFLFVVRRGAAGEPSVAVHRIDVDRASLERRVTELVRRLESRDLDWRGGARALYDLLLGPAARDLAGVEALGIVPDGILWRLPFETLVAPDGKFVVERAACFYAPSLAVLDAVETRGKARRAGDVLLAFGNPSIGDETRRHVGSVHRDLQLTPLPEAEKEVRDIGRVYGSANSRVYVRGEAVEERAKELMGGASVVHFATHGLLDDRNPMYSQLVLARGGEAGEDGVLQAWEMMQLDVGADLVVLSACDTARGRIGAGEGLIGMSWSLFVAGCPSTVATLWKIASTSTSDLMIGFHQELARRRGGSYAKAQALRAAQLRFIRDPRRRHPYYWSPFVLVGSPR